MKIKENLIMEIENMPANKVVLVGEFVNMLSQSFSLPKKMNMQRVARIRKMLAGCKTPLSQDLDAVRADRI
ncbi:MAG: hypothetical protein A2324_05620 [Candidatus Raymondbacteria bacterium RIFOXYB2_FULL_49_35]|nr:MAG: hypothetical protein A2324_05620 [Candidatus Raymondbacteria bacterium RIFOXYB2_FULL_49_35]